ncbi:hypothetical protein Hanom_Chr16g01423711 [Helianthus anomalus]
MGENYSDGPCGLPKFLIWSPAFQKYTNGPCGLHFVTPLVTHVLFAKLGT